MAKTWLAALVLVACSLTMTAQSDNNQRMSREQLAEAQAKHIASELGLDEGTTKKYVETFCDYQKEIWALGPRETGKKKTEMTDAETDQEIQARFERSEKILSIRQKYPPLSCWARLTVWYGRMTWRPSASTPPITPASWSW